MIFSLISVFLLAVYTTCITAVCTPATRLAGAQQVVTAYNLQGIGESATAFSAVPWGNQCVITMYVYPAPRNFSSRPITICVQRIQIQTAGFDNTANFTLTCKRQRSQWPPSSTILLQRIFQLRIRC